jgi:hypothetical protein
MPSMQARMISAVEAALFDRACVALARVVESGCSSPG